MSLTLQHRQPATRLWLSTGITALGLGLAAQIGAAAESAGRYETGLPAIHKISRELCAALNPAQRTGLSDRPIVVENATPFAVPVEDSSGQRAVQISSGFVEFINFLSHAKALDDADRGVLKKYSAALSTQGEARAVPLTPAVARNDLWSFDTMNHQVSHFNQMAGALLAIDLAHHYLGYYKKYASQLTDAQGQPVSINQCLTTAEWRDAVLKGARNALDCGLGIDGLKAVFDCIDRMPTRPTWTAHFLPAKADVSKIQRELEKMEKKFFLAGE